MKAFIFSLFLGIISTQAGFAHGPHDGHLSFMNGKIHAHLSWVEGPHVGEESVMALEWMDGVSHTPIQPPFSFQVYLWMPGMNHGSSPVKISPVLDSNGTVKMGLFEVSRMYFTMGGDWDVRVKIKNQAGVEELRAWKLHLHGDGHGGHH